MAAPTTLGRLAVPVVLALTALVVVVLLSERVVLLPFPFSALYGEGWNAFNASHAFSSTPLYPPLTALTANNYPPLSFYVVGLLGLFTGDEIIAGRIIALVSLFVVGVNLALMVRRMSGSTAAAIFAGLLSIGTVAAWYPNYVAANDPQWLAHALATTGMMILVVGKRTRPAVIAACALMLAGGLVKHILLPLPLAATLWLVLYDRRAFLVWMAAAVALLAAALALLYLLYGAPLFQALVAMPRSYKISTAVRQSYLFVVPLFPLLLAWLTLVAIDFGDRWTRLISIYAVLALLWGTFAVGGIGVTYNAFFDLVIALALAAGLFVAKIGEHPVFARISRPVVRAVAMVLLIQTIVVATPGPFGATIDLLRHGKAEHMSAAFAADVRFLAAQEGPAMCESLALCYWAGKPFSVDYFTTGQKMLLGAVDELTLVDLVNTRHFGAIEIDASRPDNLRRLTPGFYHALAEHYVVGRAGPDSTTIYVPKPAAATELANPAAVFCADRGGRYELGAPDTESQADTGGRGETDSAGVCILPGGIEMDAWTYFREESERQGK